MSSYQGGWTGTIPQTHTPYRPQQSHTRVPQSFNQPPYASQYLHQSRPSVRNNYYQPSSFQSNPHPQQASSTYRQTPSHLQESFQVPYHPSSYHQDQAFNQYPQVHPQYQPSNQYPQVHQQYQQSNQYPQASPQYEAYDTSYDPSYTQYERDNPFLPPTPLPPPPLSTPPFPNPNQPNQFNKAFKNGTRSLAARVRREEKKKNRQEERTIEFHKREARRTENATVQSAASVEENTVLDTPAQYNTSDPRAITILSTAVARSSSTNQQNYDGIANEAETTVIPSEEIERLQSLNQLPQMAIISATTSSTISTTPSRFLRTIAKRREARRMSKKVTSETNNLPVASTATSKRATTSYMQREATTSNAATSDGSNVPKKTTSYSNIDKFWIDALEVLDSDGDLSDAYVPASKGTVSSRVDLGLPNSNMLVPKVSTTIPKLFHCQHDSGAACLDSKVVAMTTQMYGLMVADIGGSSPNRCTISMPAAFLREITLFDALYNLDFKEYNKNRSKSSWRGGVVCLEHGGSQFGHIRKNKWTLLSKPSLTFEQRQKLLNCEAESSHLCHCPICEELGHKTPETNVANLARNICKNRAVELRIAGEAVPEKCQIHFPPCLMVQASLTLGEIAASQWLKVNRYDTVSEIPMERLGTISTIQASNLHKVIIYGCNGDQIEVDELKTFELHFSTNSTSAPPIHIKAIAPLSRYFGDVNPVPNFACEVCGEKVHGPMTMVFHITNHVKSTADERVKITDAEGLEYMRTFFMNANVQKFLNRQLTKEVADDERLYNIMSEAFLKINKGEWPTLLFAEEKVLSAATKLQAIPGWDVRTDVGRKQRVPQSFENMIKNRERYWAAKEAKMKKA